MRIAICGKFKSGKTSLINLLFGLALPVQAVTATRLVTQIERGERCYRVLEDGTRVEITAEERDKLILGEIDADISQPVRIAVGCDSKLLGEAGEVEIWDTPGLEDTPELTEITMRALEQCDLAILIFDANKFGSWYEKMTLENLQDMLGGNVVYVINRIDLLNTAEDLAHVQRSAKYLLEDYGNDIVGYGKTLFTSASPTAPDIGALYDFLHTLSSDRRMRRMLCEAAAESHMKGALVKWIEILTEDINSVMQGMETGSPDRNPDRNLDKNLDRKDIKILLDYFEYALHTAGSMPACGIGDKLELMEEFKLQYYKYAPPKIPAVCPLSGHQGGIQIPLDGRQICFGRDAEQCHVLYGDGTPGVSRLHCTLIWDDVREGFILADMDSSYGTFLENGIRLTPGKLYYLKAGESFYLGDIHNEVRTRFVQNEFRKF